MFCRCDKCSLRISAEEASITQTHEFEKSAAHFRTSSLSLVEISRVGEKHDARRLHRVALVCWRSSCWEERRENSQYRNKNIFSFEHSTSDDSVDCGYREESNHFYALSWLELKFLFCCIVLIVVERTFIFTIRSARKPGVEAIN